jgi:protocatechuate 3,4-dioxygenase beta subunit
MSPIQRIFLVVLLALPIALLSSAGMSASQNAQRSGPQKGQSVSAFEPYHATGPDKGTHTCPVCKYGMLPMVQVWVQGAPTEADAKLLKALDAEAASHVGQKLHAFAIFLRPESAEKSEGAKLATFASKNGLTHLSLLVADPKDEFVKPYHLSPNAAVHTTVLVSKRREVIENLVNPKADDARLPAAIATATR